MKNSLSALILIFCFFASSVTAYSVDPEAERKAGEYKGYDELIINITQATYKNRTYYWVDYSKSLMYSGSILIGEDGIPVEDEETLAIFSIAGMVYKGYPPESVNQWRDYSAYFAYMSAALRSSHPVLSEDARDISVYFYESADYMNGTIQTFSPDSAGGYMRTQALLMDKMVDAYDNMKDYPETSSPYLKEYKESVTVIWNTIKDNHKGLSDGGQMMADNILSRISSEKDKPFMETALIAASVFILAFLFILRKIKR